MTIKDAQEFLKIIRSEKYKANPLEHQFLIDIEQGYKFKDKLLSKNQEKWLKAIYGKATNFKGRM